MDVIKPQVHVEFRIKYIDPGAHGLDVVDWSRMDLNTARAADETHDGDFFADRQIQHGNEAVGFNAPGKCIVDGGDGLVSCQAEFTQDAHELVNIGHGGPSFAQISFFSCAEHRRVEQSLCFGIDPHF